MRIAFQLTKCSLQLALLKWANTIFHINNEFLFNYTIVCVVFESKAGKHIRIRNMKIENKNHNNTKMFCKKLSFFRRHNELHNSNPFAVFFSLCLVPWVRFTHPHCLRMKKKQRKIQFIVKNTGLLLFYAVLCIPSRLHRIARGDSI